MNDLITISFPVYNVSKTIKKSLQSVLAQTYPNIELIIIDDCGTDNSISIMQTVLKETKNNIIIRIIKHPRNLGLGAARNTSLKNASGKYIYFMDSDDILDSNCIQLLYSTIQKYQTDFVASSYATFENDISHYTSHTYPKQIILNSNIDILNYYFTQKKKIFVFMWNKLYSTSFLRKNKIQCIHPIVEDDLFLFQVLLHANSCCLLPCITYFYYINPNSITNQLMKRNISLRTSKIFQDIAKYKYEQTEQLTNKKIIPSIQLSIFTESLFRSKSIVQSSQISDKEKEEIIQTLFKIPKLHLSILDWIILPLKEKGKAILYQMFHYGNITSNNLFFILFIKNAKH